MKRILVVDDQEDLRGFLSKALIPNGYEVDSAEDGMAALGQVKRKKYDLIIADYEMPKMDGIDLLRKLKVDNPSLSVLMISGSGIEETFFKRCGADAYLTKPFDLLQMKKLVKKILHSSEE
jgi:two-component system response regulator AtoC